MLVCLSHLEILEREAGVPLWDAEGTVGISLPEEAVVERQTLKAKNTFKGGNFSYGELRPEGCVNNLLVEVKARTTIDKKEVPGLNTILSLCKTRKSSLQVRVANSAHFLTEMMAKRNTTLLVKLEIEMSLVGNLCSLKKN